MSLPISYLENVLHLPKISIDLGSKTKTFTIDELVQEYVKLYNILEEIVNESKIKKQQSTDEKKIESKQRVERTKTEDKRTAKGRSSK